MNKVLLLLIFWGSFLFSGCLSSRGYTPNDDIRHIELNKKYAITYSVDFVSHVKYEDIVDLKDSRIEWIKDYLEDSGAFSDVSYRDLSSKSNYHICFIVRLSSPDTAEAVDAGVISGLTLCTIPICSDRFYYDITAVLYLNNEIVCAPSTSERISELIWLPLLPALFYPPVLVRKSVEKKCYRFLINEILEEHKKIVAKKSSKKTTSNNFNSSNKKTGTSNGSKTNQTTGNSLSLNTNNPSSKTSVSELEQSIVETYADKGNGSVEHLREEAEQGSPSAQTFIGMCYEIGYGGIKQDYDEAVKWYRKAAEQGYAAAQFSLGFCLSEGIGCKQNNVEAVKWYQKAAEQGNASAQQNLGYCFGEGIGVKQDYVEAFKWFRKAAEQGSMDAQFNLSVCYRNGKGVKKNLTEATRWVRKAAEQGHGDAQFVLGQCYLYGEGVKKNEDEAVKWFRKAAEHGDEDAKRVLRELGY